MKQQIYLDYAAATPVEGVAQQKALPYLSDNFYNPSALYQSSRLVRKDLEGFRSQVANVLGSKDQEIVFTAGGSEANNIAIHGVMKAYPEGNIVVSAIEHSSVMEAALQYDVRVAPVSNQGILDTGALKNLIDNKTVLVSVMYANNEVGSIQPIKEISSIINETRNNREVSAGDTDHLPLYLHTDACQAANYLDLSVSRLGIDLMTLNGGKIYAMKQSGCLYIRSGVGVEPFINGGGQENGIRSGTENIAAICTFATMLQIVQNERKKENSRINRLRAELIATLSQKIDNIVVNNNVKKSLPNFLNISFPGVDGERLVLELDERGLMTATGSACAASDDEPSHVLTAMGIDEQIAGSSLRLTLGRGSTKEQIQQAAGKIIEVVNDYRY